MFQRRPAGTWLLPAMALILLAACSKDKPKPQWDVDLVIPLVKASLTIGDLVPDSMLSTDSEGRVSILHSMELFSLSLDTVLTAPDTSFLYAYALPFTGPIQFPPGATFDASDDVTRFDLDDLQLSKLIVRSGQVDITISNMMNGNIIGNFALPGASLGGIPFDVQMALPPGTPATPSTTTDSRPLDGYTFDLRGPQFNAVNSLATHLSYSNAPNGSTVTITDQDSLLATVSYHGIVPQYALGSFGTRAIEVEPDTTTLDLFTRVTGLLDLDQAEAKVTIRNGLGVDARAEIHYITGLNTRDGSEVGLQAGITSGPVNIDRAIDLGNGFSPSSKNFLLDPVNSNIVPFLENLPDRIAYAMDITINPLGDISNGHDFLYHDSRVTANLDVDIPLRFIATDLTLRKMLTLDLGENGGGQALNSGTLHVFVENGFPFSASVELALIGADGQVLSILQPGGTIPAGIMGSNGFVAAPTAGRLDFRVEADQLDRLRQNGQIEVKAVFNTADQGQHIQLIDTYRMDLQVTLDANYMVNGSE